MGRISLNPYLFFGGNCKEAMEFYKSVFGGELKIQTNADVPEDVKKQMSEMGEVNENGVMHADLSGGDITLFGSDSPKASPKAAKIELALGGDDQERLHEIFNALSEGGKVGMPLQKQFWGDTFGQLTDKYNIDWMVNISTPAS